MMSEWVYMMSECSVYDEWMSVYDEWLSVYDEWMSVYDEWLNVYDEWMSVYDEWISVYDEWMSVYDEWMQWVLGVCKDMNGDCVWRMLGECRCERLPNKITKTSRYLANYYVWQYTTFVYVFLKINWNWCYDF